MNNHKDTLIEPHWNRITALLDRLPHAILITGPRGIGKLAIAERFAKLLLCERPTNRRTPCGACTGCTWFEAATHPDLRRIEPDALAPSIDSEDETVSKRSGDARAGKLSHDIRIDQIRELADFIGLGAHRGGRRIIIIHPAESMNVHAANALLKSLEEPPAGAVFLLVSHLPTRLLPTVLSRCTTFPVPLPDPQIASEWLASLGVENAARWLSFTGGCPLVAAELATETGNRAEVVLAALDALERGDRPDPSIVKDRDGIETLIDVIQKFSLDQALSCLGASSLFGSKTLQGRVTAGAWLEVCRRMGRARRVAGHPLNVQLFASQISSYI